MKMKKFLLCLLCLLCLTGCGKEEESFIFSAAVGSAYTTLDPIYAETECERSIIAHMYENLMRVSADASGSSEAVYGLAKSVEQETDVVSGTVTYTFRLRSAKWSDGVSVTAEDVVYAWQRLACPVNDSPHARLMSCVVGYDEVRESGDVTKLAVSAKNDTTLEVTLTGDHGWFLTDVCTDPAAVPVRRDLVPTAAHQTEEAVETSDAAMDWWKDVETTVISGPYRPESKGTQYLRVVRNEEHYAFEDTTGPDAIVFRFTHGSDEAESLLDKGEVDAAWPVRVTEYNAEEELHTYTVVFNCSSYPFQDRMLRRAVAGSLDRNALADLAGGKAAEALVPGGVPDSQAEDFRTCAGPLLDNVPEHYAQRCGEALQILQASGYQSGRDLGALTYTYLDEGTNGAVAEELCRQLGAMLGMEVTPVPMNETEFAEALAAGEFMMAGMDVESYYNDAEGFLAQWASDASANVGGYENTAYDTLMAIIASAPDGTARLGCLHDAEELVMDDAAVAPIYTTETAWECRENITGAFRDERGWFGFYGVQKRAA